MWMQSPFITDQVYRLHFMAAEVKRVALLCATLPAETAEASVLPSHHQACQHKTTSLSGFHSLYNWSKLRKTHVSQFRVVLPDNLNIFGMTCPETNASCSKHTGAFMDGYYRRSCWQLYWSCYHKRDIPLSEPQSSLSCDFAACLLFHVSFKERQN